jgi:hypothetical protein
VHSGEQKQNCYHCELKGMTIWEGYRIERSENASILCYKHIFSLVWDIAMYDSCPRVMVLMEIC